MFKELIARFTSDKPFHTPLAPLDARHALGALLVRVAKADKAYLFQEIEEIDLLLSQLYGLKAVEAAKMRAACEKLEREMPSIDDLGHIIRDGVDDAEKDKMVRGLWSVVDADGMRLESEEEVVALATEAFGMSPEHAARLRA